MFYTRFSVIIEAKMN